LEIPHFNSGSFFTGCKYQQTPLGQIMSKNWLKVRQIRQATQIGQVTKAEKATQNGKTTQTEQTEEAS
jgi:hypothetical protein